MPQTIVIAEEKYDVLDSWIDKNNTSRIMVICGRSIDKHRVLREYMAKLEACKKVSFLFFMDFEPNPRFESVIKGIQFYREQSCDSIIAIGGGSAIDVAKCIKKYNKASLDTFFIKTDIYDESIPFMVIPTTAGTGSEVTKYAVIYYEGEKQSITDERCKPDTVLLDGSLIDSLPLCQKKVTMMDALCHAVESFWSVNSNSMSKKYSSEAISMILDYKDMYLANERVGNINMLLASNIAGKAIDITQTTAGHAMSYKLTSLFNIHHGHAVGLCNKVLFPYLISNTDHCMDERGKEYLDQMLGELALAFRCKDIFEAEKCFEFIFDNLKLDNPVPTSEEYSLLKKSVNQKRLKNFPILLTENVIDELYHSALE